MTDLQRFIKHASLIFVETVTNIFFEKKYFKKLVCDLKI